MTKTLIIEQILFVHENFKQTIHKNRCKTNTECVFKHLIVCSPLKRPFFSQEIPGEELLPTGGHEENNALVNGYYSQL